MSYLLANGADPNAQDHDGYTPLHLAVKTSEVVKNSRIVKQLLFGGAEREIKNIDGLKPMDYAKGIQIGHIAADIKKALVEPKYCSFLLLTQPLKKMKKEVHTAVSFVILMAALYFFLYYYVFPFEESLTWFISINFLFTCSCILWLMSALKDPGYLRKSEKIEFITLVERFDPACLCPTGHIIRTPRSRH